jgi:glycosyltransferase involved in cell wall biosynthesis
MKILFIQKMAGVSGSERYLLSIMPELKQKNIDISFLVLQHPKNSRKNSNFIQKLQSHNIQVFILNSYFQTSLSLIYGTASIVRAHKFTILHTNLIHADFLGACVKKFFHPGIKLLSTKHGYSDKFQGRHGFDFTKLKPDLLMLISKWSAYYADKVVCISQSLTNFYKDSGMIQEKKLLTIPYGFNFSNIHINRDNSNLNFGSPQLIVTGRLEPVKQHHLLLEILPELKYHFPNLSVVMVGDGSLHNSLLALSKKLGVSNYVHWVGFQENVHSYIKNSDLMIVPSRSEGFGLVVLEAWYHSKPVIGFNVPALNNVVESGKDGILVEPFSSKALLNAAKEMLSNQEKLELFGQAGHQKQEEVFGIDSMTASTMKALQELKKNDNLESSFD